jgi:hypothetical protein
LVFFAIERGSIAAFEKGRDAMNRKDLVSFGITVEALVEWTISTSGNREYLSARTRRYSPVGRGP